MAEIYLVRHGQASFGSANYDQLSPLGEQQSVWLGEYFAQRELRFDAIVTGTQQRHAQTAAGIWRGMALDQHSPSIEAYPGLNEYDFASLYKALGEDTQPIPSEPTAQRRYYYRRLKIALQRWSENNLPGPLPETWVEFQQRVRVVLKTVQQRKAERILMVSSGGPTGLITQQALDAPNHAAIEMSLQIRNTGLCQFYVNDHALRIMSFNTIPHLDQRDRLNAITFA